MKKQVSTEQNEANIREVLRLLAEMPIRLEGLGKALTEGQLGEPLGKGERSINETLAHILNCEARTSEAITLALLAKEPPFTPIHPERELGKLLGYEELPFDELLAYFKFRRKVMLKALTSLKESQWSRTVRQEGKQRRESVYWQARGQALHELEHVLELERKLALPR